ncbi:MAG: ArsB/NhaD family transporter [Candidatus Bathyarchaeia archaeon]
MSLPSAWVGVQPWMVALISAFIMFIYNLLLARSNVLTVLKRMPWKIVPFLIGLFVIVESMASSGWTSLLALQLSKISHKHYGSSACGRFLVVAYRWFNEYHPTTVFFVKALQSPAFSASPIVKLGSILALVVGSNLGANFMLTGALAGLMWAKIRSNKGYSVSFSEFSKYAFLLKPIVVFWHS